LSFTELHFFKTFSYKIFPPHNKAFPLNFLESNAFPFFSTESLTFDETILLKNYRFCNSFLTKFQTRFSFVSIFPCFQVFFLLKIFNYTSEKLAKEPKFFLSHNLKFQNLNFPATGAVVIVADCNPKGAWSGSRIILEIPPFRLKELATLV
jgi:hypothetical protein